MKKHLILDRRAAVFVNRMNNMSCDQYKVINLTSFYSFSVGL